MSCYGSGDQRGCIMKHAVYSGNVVISIPMDEIPEVEHTR